MEKQLTYKFKDIKNVNKNWIWFFLLGLLLILVGTAAIGSSFFTTLFSIVVLGVFLLFAGVVQIVQAVLAHKWSGFFLSLLLGLLYLVTGFFCVKEPGTTAVAITFWIAAFCFIGGLFRMIASLLLRFEHWGWVFFNGIVTFLLGLMIYNSWPYSGLWVIGLFVGIDMILSGWSWVLLSLFARQRK